jgi:bifunctional non-homologous end joining protein LigD
MLATLVDEPFHREGWIFEEKYDGYRILACKHGRAVDLRSRNANDKTRQFAEIAEGVGILPARDVILDGEVVGFDEHLISRFQLIGGTKPLVYAVFDCLYLNGRDLRDLPLSERRAELEALIGNTDRLLPSRRLAKNGLGAYRTARRRGYEGVVAKDLASRYVSGRSRQWLKVKVRREEEFVIGGYTAPEGARSGFGALLLGAYQADALRYVGKVGAGFTNSELKRLAQLFSKQQRADPAFVPPPRQAGVTWMKPRFVAQVEFQEWTDDQKLRQPVFLGLRDDKAPSECRLPEVHHARR